MTSDITFNYPITTPLPAAQDSCKQLAIRPNINIIRASVKGTKEVCTGDSSYYPADVGAKGSVSVGYTHINHSQNTE